MSKETTSIEYGGTTFILIGEYNKRVWTTRFEEGNDASFDIEKVMVEDSNIDISEMLPDSIIETMQDLAKEQLNDY